MVWEEGHWLPWGVGGESLGDMSLRENGKRGNGKTTPEIFAEVLKDKGESVCGRDSIQTRMLHSQPSHCLQEGGGEEMALKKIDGDRRAGVGGRSKSTTVGGDLRVLWGLARSKSPEMEPKVSF